MGKKEADKKLKLRFGGEGGAKVDLITSQNSSFKKKRLKSLIKKNKKIKVLIAPHDFLTQFIFMAICFLMIFMNG